VAESPEHARERKTAAREAARRREAVTVLAVAEATIGYARRQLGNGLSPPEARQCALETAAELASVADQLRRLTRLRPADRRALAAGLANFGLTTRQIARQLGVSDRAVRNYVVGRRSDGKPWAVR
jgi:hypothetical protein